HALFSLLSACYGYPLELHSFPTRRSSDLTMREAVDRVSSGWQHRVSTHLQRFAAGSAMLLQWANGSGQYVVAVRRFDSGVTELVHIPTSPDGQQASASRVL